MKKVSILFLMVVLNSFVLSENDPLEEINRTTLKINKTLDSAIATPVATLYQKVTPDFIEVGIYNVISNVDSPTTSPLL